MPFHKVILGFLKDPSQRLMLDLRKHVPDEEVARRVSEAGGFALGRYNEKRLGTYTDHQGRNIHMGIDVFAPVGTPVHAFADGEIWCAAYRAAAGDYGGTIITRHELHTQQSNPGEGQRPTGNRPISALGAGPQIFRPLFALHGHLSRASVEAKTRGQAVRAGDVLGQVGDRTENGGWLPHLHFQLSWDAPTRGDTKGQKTGPTGGQMPAQTGDPTVCDFPGVVSDADHAAALLRYPDPLAFFAACGARVV